MRIVVLDHIPSEPEFRKAWNDLALQMEHPEVFYTYEWANAVQIAYREQMTPLIVLGYEGESLVGVAALAQKRAGNVVFLTADTGDYCDFLSAPAIRKEFMREVLSALRSKQVRKAIFTNLPGDSASAALLSPSCASVGYHVHSRAAYACSRVMLGAPEERVEVKKALFARKRFRRNIRELQKRGALTLQHETDSKEIEALLMAFVRAHIARFLETGKISSLIKEERRAFLRELARGLSEPGWIAFSRLLVGNLTAAWNYGFRFAGSWFWYQPTVNDFFADFSPGYCLLGKIVEQSCDSPEIDIVDLGLGAEGYKDRFATANRDTLYCELNRSAVKHAQTVARYRAARMGTASPKIERYIRITRDFAKNLRQRISSPDESLVKRSARRVRMAVFNREDVLFFEWPTGHREAFPPSTSLLPLDSAMLGEAAVQYGNDPAAVRFLMRSAQRLRSGEGEGFALVTSEGVPVHFCWARDFEGFHMAELDRRLNAPCQNAIMIFDCFTPQAARGNGFFSDAITRLAQQLDSQGKSAWIFGAATNHASVQGIQKTSFQYRFTLGRRRILFFNQAKGSVLSTQPSQSENTVSTS